MKGIIMVRVSKEANKKLLKVQDKLGKRNLGNISKGVAIEKACECWLLENS